MLFLVATVVVKNPVARPLQASPVVSLPRYIPSQGGHGGGGDHDRNPASQGVLPRLSLDPQIVPPAAVVRNQDPKLAMEPTIVAPPEIKVSHLGPLGDPFGVPGPPSNGPGSHGGIGPGDNGGVGPGSTPGAGPFPGSGCCGVPFRVGGGVSAPFPIYAPDPEFTDDARKSKHQGVVILQVVIGADGRAHNMRVVQPLGLGLDQKAVEAVGQWKFEPARKDGRAVPVAVNIEVTFRLF